jgi:hypothetical protein
VGSTSFTLLAGEDINIDKLQVSQITGDTLVPCNGLYQGGDKTLAYVYFAAPLYSFVHIGSPGTVITAVSDGAPACQQDLKIGT